jgi:hypothetical protein
MRYNFWILQIHSSFFIISPKKIQTHNANIDEHCANIRADPRYQLSRKSIFSKQGYKSQMTSWLSAVKKLFIENRITPLSNVQHSDYFDTLLPHGTSLFPEMDKTKRWKMLRKSRR